MARLMRNIACIVFAALFTYSAEAESSSPDSVKINEGAELEIRQGYVFPTKSFFRGDNATGKPIRSYTSAHIRYSFKFDHESYYGRLYPTAYQGIGASLNSFDDRKEMGMPIAIYIFQGAPFATLSSNLTLGYEWNFGASFGWKEYDAVKNPNNDVVGSDINAYMDIGLTLHWNVRKCWNIVAGLNLTHYSNGNTDYPNYGVNIVGGKIGLVGNFGNERNHLLEKAGKRLSTPFKPHLGCDIVIYGATRRKGINWPNDSYLVPGSFGIAGLNLNPMWSFNKYFRAGISTDAQYDESANIKDHFAGASQYGEVKFHRPPFREQFAIGLSVRAELTMPIFSVNMGIGRNIIYKGNDTDCFYQILALKAAISHNAFIHIGYQLNNFHTPNNLMVGFGYRFE